MQHRGLAEDARGTPGSEAKTDELEAEKPKEEPAEEGEGAESKEPEPEEVKLSEEEVLQKELEEIQEKVRKQKHKLLLSLADFENTKKRFFQEREKRRRASVANFARKIVELDSDFSRVTLPETDGHSGPSQALNEGVALTRDLFKATLSRFDVNRLDPEIGQHVVPARHDNVGTLENANLAHNSVAEVVRHGWILEGGTQPVVLQRAQVKVSGHGPQTPPPPDA